MSIDFPRTDLAPLRHQQVRGLLVREARTATGRRVPRRVVPLVAGLSVVGAVALPTTGLGGALGAAVGSAVSSFTNPCPPSGGVGYSPERRRPKASDDTAGVRFLPPGTPSKVIYRMESDCPLPERADRPVMRPHPVWTLARDSGGELDAVVILYRGLPEGISSQVADRTSRRLPTDSNDPGTVLDPPFRPVAVRGTTGTLTERGAASPYDTVSLIWSEQNGRQWSLQAFGLSASELVGVADRLEVTVDGVEPGERRVFRLADVADVNLSTPAWFRFDLPEPRAARVDEVMWSGYLLAYSPGLAAGTSMVTELHEPAASWQDWRVRIRPGDRLVRLRSGDGLLQHDSGAVSLTAAEPAFTSLLFDLPGGSQVGMSLRGPDAEPLGDTDAVAQLVHAAESLAVVPTDDPRLRDAIVDE